MPNDIHEIVGVIFVILLVVHHVFNWRWYKGLKKGKYNLIRLLHAIVNLSLVGLILVNIISALGISLWLFTFLPFNWGMTGRTLHIASAYWGMILLSMHIGFHWDMLMNMARKLLHLSPSYLKRTLVLRIVTFIIAIDGIYAIYKLDIGARLIAYYSFFFFDPTQSYLLLLIDYVSLFGLGIAFTHYGLKVLRHTQKRA